MECTCVDSPTTKLTPKSWKKVLVLGVVYILLFSEIAEASLMSCKSCPPNYCCVGKQFYGVGACEKRLGLNSVCMPQSETKYTLLRNGAIGTNQCGCEVGLVCKRIVRKRWKEKRKIWNRKKRARKTKYKYRCREIPREIEEFLESF